MSVRRRSPGAINVSGLLTRPHVHRGAQCSKYFDLYKTSSYIPSEPYVHNFQWRARPKADDGRDHRLRHWTASSPLDPARYRHSMRTSMSIASELRRPPIEPALVGVMKMHIWCMSFCRWSQLHSPASEHHFLSIHISLC